MRLVRQAVALLMLLLVSREAQAHDPYVLASPVHHLATIFTDLYGPDGLKLDSLATLPDEQPHTAHFNSDFQFDFSQFTSALVNQFVSVPLPSPSAGFTYEFDPSLGVFRRATNVYRTVSESGGVGKDSDKIKVRCLPSTLFPSPTAGYQLARVITDEASLIDGPLARGQLGDVLLANDKLQAVIRKPGRTTLQIGTYGGNIIDADRQRIGGRV